MVSSLFRTAGLVALGAVAVSGIQVIEKDVVVIGGGASGAYAAFTLREDYGKSVALIEKQKILVGGHGIEIGSQPEQTRSYTDHSA